MSRTIEDRIVNMQFQNKQFEDAVAQSRQSIQLLEKDLKLLEGVQALKNIDVAVQSIDVSSIARGIETLNDRFSTLGIIGMTVTQNLTNAFMGSFLSAINSAGKAITGVFSTVMQKGFNRATNIEQAKFSLQGLLTSQYGNDIATIEERTKAISSAIDKSVTDTAYGYDQAARAASTLVATYGSTDEGVSRVLAALNGIAGVAAQTGASYDQVAQVFTTVAGNGRVMGMQLNQIAGYGLNAAKAIADYINEDTAASRQIKKNLKIRGDATEAEVRDLVSKGKITADIFNEAFYVFRQNAGRANETVSGVMSNINAAMGRLGAAFIEPIIANQGPWVEFLNEVRLLVKDIANIITKDFKIPEKTTELITNLLSKTTEVLHEFRESIGENDIFRRLNNISETLRSAFDLSGTTDEAKEEAITFGEIYTDQLRRWEEKTLGTRKTFSDFIKDLTGMSNVSLNTIEELYRIDPDRVFGAKGLTVREILSGVLEANRLQNEEIHNEIEGVRATSETMYANTREVATVWETNYFQNFVTAFKTFGEAFSTIGSTISESIGDSNPVLKEFFDILSGNETGQFELRKVLNSLSEAFLNFSNKFKEVVEGEDFKGIINGLVGVFNVLGRVVSAVWTIIKNAFTSFQPLFERVLTLFGALGDTIYDSEKELGELGWIEKVVEGISTAIDIFAKVLIFIWDILVGFLDAIKPENFGEVLSESGPFIEKIIGILKVFGEYIGNNIPIWVEKAKPYIEWFGDKVLEIAGWLKDKLGEAFNFVSPYVDTFVGWLSEVTDGAIDLEQPIQQVTDILNDNQETLDAVSTAAEDVSEAFTGMTDVFGGATGSTLLGAPAAVFNGLAAALVDTSENKEKLDEMMQDEAATAEKVLTPWEKIKTTVTTVIETIKKWTKDKLEDFGILGDLVSIWDSIVGFFKGIKEKVGEINTEKVLNIIEGILGIVTVTLAKLAALKMGTDITGAIKKLPDMFTSISGTIRTFSPFYADVMKADNATTRREAMADILKSLAAVIIGIAIAVGVIAYAVYKLGEMDYDKLTQGLSAMGMIFGAVGLVLLLLCIFMNAMTGQNTSSTDVKSHPLANKIKGIKSFYSFVKTGNFYESTKTVTTKGADVWKSIAAIGGVLVAFAAAVGIIALAVWGLGKIPQEQLNRGMGAFVQIAGVIAILMILLGAFAYLLSGGSSSGKGEFIGKLKNDTKYGVITQAASKGGTWKASKDSADWKVLAAMGVALALIAGSISVIMWTISLIANVPMENLDKSLEVFREVVIAVGLLLVILGVFASLMTLFNRGSEKSIAGPLIAMAVMLAIIMLGISGIMQILVEIALLPIKPERMDKAVEMFEKVCKAIGILIGIVGAIITVIVGLTALGAIKGSNGNKMANALGGVAAIIATLAVLFIAIGASFILMAIGIGKMSEAMKDLNPSQLHSIVAVIAIFTGLVAVVLGCVIALMAISTYVDVGGSFLAMLAIIASMFIAIGAVFLSIGVMAKMISESGIDLNGLVTIISIVGVIIGGIMVCVAVILALCSTGIGEAALASLAIIAALFGALGLLFISIGVAAVGVGLGLNLITDALIKFINFFAEEMSEEKTGAVMSNLEKFLYGLGTVIFAGLLGVAAFLDVNKERVVEAIKKIVSFILEAIWASFVQTFESNLEGLTQIIELLDLWIKKNKFEIERIIMNLGEILYTVINTFMDNIMKLILGSNYDGGTDGLLGQLTNGIINWLYTFFLNEDAVGRTLLNDLFTVIGETAHQGILDFFQLIIDSQDVPTKALEAVDSVIVGITEALVIKGPEIIDHVKELIRVIWALVLYALGVTDAVPHSSMYGIAGGTTKGDPEGAMTDWGDDMSSGLANYDWLGAVGRFLSNLWNTMLNVAAGANNILPGSGGLLGLGKILADRIIQGMHEEGQGGSPWGATEQEGIWAVQGAEIGLRNRQANARLEQAARNVSTTVVQSMRSGIDLASSTSPIMSGFVSEFNKLKDRLGLFFSPLLEGIEAKITPYMDLSQIQEGFGSIQDMMNGNSEFDISAISDENGLSSLGGDITVSDEAAETAEGFDLANMPDMSGMEELSPETILNFTQNNYSPESLSRIDIYRDTKNMLSNPSLQSMIQNTNAYRLINSHSGGGGGSF